MGMKLENFNKYKGLFEKKLRLRIRIIIYDKKLVTLR